VIFAGKYSDDYLLSTNDAVLWEGGSTHAIDVSFLYETKVFGRDTEFTLRLRDVVDFSNRDGRRPSGGFVDQFTGEETLQFRNVTPIRWELGARVRF
jgi:hypothetical protein